MPSEVDYSLGKDFSCCLSEIDSRRFSISAFLILTGLMSLKLMGGSDVLFSNLFLS